jgi:subtilase family serine protease
LHDFMPHPMYKPRANYTFIGGNGNTYYAVAPADLATIYNMNLLFNDGISGQGQTVVVLEDSDVYSTADWNTFRSAFGLSQYTSGSLTQVNPAPPSGTNNCIDPGVSQPDDAETAIDTEWASAAAPSATIEVASCADTNTTFGGLIALLNLVNGSAPPTLVSMSYSQCEAGAGESGNAAYYAAYQQAVTAGISVFVSAGDSAASSCSAALDVSEYGIGVSGFASTPYNVAVGGTDFGDTYANTNSTYWSSTNSPTYESALSYVPEIPWNDSCASVLIATTVGGPGTVTYGSAGFCNSSTGEDSFLNTEAGSGGPSGCATGTPSTLGVVGGTCAGWPKPSWQSLVGNPSDGVRDIPDVALFAANGVWGHYFPACLSDPAFGFTCNGAPENWVGAGGTSFSSPIMAGIQALVNQRAGGPQGNPNPVYYQLAAAEYGANGNSSCNSTLGNAADSSCIFYDVTLGDMDIPCVGTDNCYLPSGQIGVLSTSNSAYQPAYASTTGWDFATGIGTVNVFNLTNNWPGVLPITITTTTLIASPSTICSGSSVTFAATVTGASPTGTVTFYNGASSLGTGTLNAGVATLSTTALVATGADSITAVYAGHANNLGSTSNTFTETVSAATFSISAVPATQTIPSGGAATIPITVVPQGIYTSPITFTATLTPTSSGAQVSFSPPTVTPNGSPAATTLTISGATAAAIAGSARATNDALPLPRRNGMKSSALKASALWMPIGLAGILLLGRRKKYGWTVVSQFLLAALLVVIALTMLGCGSSSGSQSHSQTYQVQITATAAASGNSGAVTTTTTVAFTVQ